MFLFPLEPKVKSLSLPLCLVPLLFFQSLRAPLSEIALCSIPSMARNSQESSRRHFHWTTKVGSEEGGHDHDHNPSSSTFKSSSSRKEDHKRPSSVTTPRKKLPAVAVARLRSVLSTITKHRSSSSTSLGSQVTGTLFGYRNGHVHFAFQKDPNSPPAFLVELATSVTSLVREMASGLVRIALECDKAGTKQQEQKNSNTAAVRLLEEPLWRTYCNGKKCGFANKRECGGKEWKVLKAVEPISMGAGVLPAGDGVESEVIYMRAKFERVVGSRDSEAFYMMNPDSNGAPELSVYLLRL